LDSQCIYILIAVAQRGSFYFAVFKVHRNPKTNVKAKTNPNPDLQKTWKKNFKNVKK